MAQSLLWGLVLLGPEWVNTNYKPKACCTCCYVQNEDVIRQHVVLEHLHDYFTDLVPEQKIYTCNKEQWHLIKDIKQVLIVYNCYFYPMDFNGLLPLK